MLLLHQQLLLGVVLLLLLSSLVGASAYASSSSISTSTKKEPPLPDHDCIHDTEVIPIVYKHQPWVSLPQRFFRGRRRAAAQAADPQPIRIKFSTLDLYNQSKYCTEAGEIRPTMKPPPATTHLQCTAEGVLTDQKRNDLINTYLPKAMTQLSEVLKVIPLAEPIVGISDSLAPLYEKPQAWIDNGVPDCDFALLVSTGVTKTNNIAFASTVASVPDGADVGRPLMGSLHIGTSYVPANVAGNEHNIEKFMSTLLHELTHALGLSWFALSNNFMKPSAVPVLSQATFTRGGLQVTEMVSPAVRDAARAFLQCESVAGMEMEIFGGDGTAGSHWSRRSAYESYMTGVQGEINRIDNITLAAFKDMGYYYPNFDKAQPMYYGNGTGCPFVQEKCNSPALSERAAGMFCMSTKYADKDVPQCNYNLHGIGRCKISDFVSDLESYFQYYSEPNRGGSTPLMQYCPFTTMFSNQRCWIDKADDASDPMLGHTFGPGGRCVDAADLVQSQFGPPNAREAPVRCVRMKCKTQKAPGYLWGGRRWQLLIQVRNTAWLECPYDGAAGSIAAPSGYSGTIQCPAAEDVCIPGSKGHGADIAVEEEPEITSSTLTTYYVDNNGSTYTLSPPTQAPPSTTTTTSTAAPPVSRKFTLGVASDPSKCTEAVQPTNTTWILLMKQAIAADLAAELGLASGSVFVRPLAADGNGCLAVNVDIPASADGDFTSKVVNGANVAALFPSASSVMLENAPASLTPSSLALNDVGYTPTTTPPPPPPPTSSAAATTTSAAGGSGGTTTAAANAGGAAESDGGPMCFIGGQPCWVSNIVLGICIMVVVAVISKLLCGKKGDKNKNDNEEPVLANYEREMQPRGGGRPTYNDL